MEMITYWLKGFKNIADYHNPARRSELNYFILMQLIVNVLLMILTAVLYTVLTIRGIDPNSAKVLTILPFFVITFLMTSIPELALIKRRLIDITPNRANLLFWLMFIAFAISMICQVLGLFMLPEMAISKDFPAILVLKYFVVCSVNFMFGTAFTVGLIVLMCKKGKI